MRFILLLAMAAMSAPAAADIIAVYEQGPRKRPIQFEINENGDFRAGDERHYRLVHGDDAYQVARIRGETFVAHVADLSAALRATTSPLLRAAAKTATFLGSSSDQHWVRGPRRTINGWRGREYRLEDVSLRFDPDEAFEQNHETTTVVVSDDPRLEPVGDAVLRYTSEELYLKRSLVSGTSYDAVLRELDDLANLGAVIASSEDDIRLVKVEKAELDAPRLDLPGVPLTREEIIALIKAKENPFKLD